MTVSSKNKAAAAPSAAKPRNKKGETSPSITFTPENKKVQPEVYYVVGATFVLWGVVAATLGAMFS